MTALVLRAEEGGLLSDSATRWIAVEADPRASGIHRSPPGP